MLKRVTINNQRKLIESQVNSCSISIYYNLYPMALEQGEEGVIYDFNIHKLLRILESRGIKSSYRQVKNSINELLEAGLIYYPYTSVKLTDVNYNELHIDMAAEEQYATLRNNTLSTSDQLNNIKLKTEKAKLVPHIYLNDMLLTNDFYKLNVRAKRCLIYIFNNFNDNPINLSKGKAKTNLNIRKAATKNYLETYMHLNNETKIHNTIEELEPFLNFHIWQKKKNQRNRTYCFRLSKESRKAYTRKLISYEQLIAFDPELKKVILTYFKSNSESIDIRSRMNLVQSFIYLKKKNFKKIISDIFKYKSKTINHMTAYFHKAINAYYFYKNNEANDDYYAALKSL